MVAKLMCEATRSLTQSEKGRSGGISLTRLNALCKGVTLNQPLTIERGVHPLVPIGRSLIRASRVRTCWCQFFGLSVARDWSMVLSMAFSGKSDGGNVSRASLHVRSAKV